MHKSRLAGFIIDCQGENLPAATQFWSAALGMPLDAKAAPEEHYSKLDSGALGLHIEVQQVSHPSRVHLDIEADDIEAEVCRLEQLGATRIDAIKGWVVMQAPTGQRFCVVRPQSADFAARASLWK